MEKKSGFTLIEIIVAMAILAIVASGLMGNFFSSQKKGRDAKRKSDLEQIQNALEAYANDHNGLYPDDDSNGKILGCDVDSRGACAWGSSNEFKSDSTNQATIYMKKIPGDPKTGKTYYYVVTPNNVGYKLYACLENSDDTKAQTYHPNDNPGDNECGGCQYRDGSGSLVDTDCNYGVSSTNESL